MKSIKKAIALFLAMLMILAVSPIAAFAAEGEEGGTTTETPTEPEEVTPEAAWYTSFNLKSGEGTLAQAAAMVVRTGKIVLLKDVELSETVKFATGATLDGSGFTVKRADDFKGDMFTVDNNAKITIANVTLDGNGANVYSESGSVIKINDGDVFLEDKAVITNNKTGGMGGAAVYVGNDTTKAESSFTMQPGSSITNCEAAVGGAVAVSYNSIFNMRGGVISNCEASRGGAVLMPYSGASFTLFEGEIKNCYSTNDIVCAGPDTTITLLNGNIHDNKSALGAVYVAQGAKISVGENLIVKDNFDTNNPNGVVNIELPSGVIMNVVSPFGENAKIGVTAEDFDASNPVLNFINYGENDISGIIVNDADGKAFFTTDNGIIMAESVKVAFDPANGTCSVGSKVYAAGEKFGALPQPDAREGFEFLGWYTDNDVLVTADSTVPSGDITLHAKWENLNKIDTNPFAVIGRFFQRIGELMRMTFEFLANLFAGTGDKNIDKIK